MIQTHSLSVRYGDQIALRDITLHIPAGKITAIVGPSGCGKTSFLLALNRLTDLVSQANVAGRILLNGVDIHTEDQNGNKSVAALRRQIGMIFQKPNPFPMSIRRNLELAPREHGQRRQDALNQLTQRALRDVGLWDEVKHRLDHPALQLSGGQQQRLCIARAIALEPEVLLMDEPCSSLDPIASSTVEKLIERLRGRYTIVIVTHNLAQARRIADQIAIFWVREGAGEMVEHGPTEQVFTDPQHPVAAEYLRGERG